MLRIEERADGEKNGCLSGGGAGGQWGGGQFISCYVAVPSGSQHVSSLPYSVTQLCLTLCDPMDYRGHQAPLAMEFSRQEYCSGCHFLLQGDLPDPRIKPMSPASCVLAGGFLTTEPPGKLLQSLNLGINTFGCPPISRS